MKAILLTQHGGPETMRYGDSPDPVAGPGEGGVDIHAASVNGADPKVRLGKGRYKLDKFPHILGRDFSGIVSALGQGVTDFKIGDAVFGVTDQGLEGAYAEKIAIKAAIIAKKPASLSHAQGAALGLISLTALTAIEDTAKLKAGENILIQGGAGGEGRGKEEGGEPLLWGGGGGGRRGLRGAACQDHRRHRHHHRKRREPR